MELSSLTVGNKYYLCHMGIKSKGLGDSIEKVTRATGIKTVVKKAATAVGVDDCGCNKRRDTLNRVFPYNKE